jgi:hypothetical protein
MDSRMTLIRLLALLGLLLSASGAQALRCGDRVTQLGDHLLQVREICGEPFWVDRHVQLQVRGEGSVLEQSAERLVEVWYFNFGSNRLMQQVVFLDSRLQREATLEYGFDRPSRGCNPDRLPIGLTNGEIVARCGAPLFQRDYYAETIQRDGYGNATVRPQRREEWTYRAGSSRRQRLLQIVDGHLVQVETLR